MVSRSVSLCLNPSEAVDFGLPPGLPPVNLATSLPPVTDIGAMPKLVVNERSWGSATFDALLEQVQTAKTSDERGRSLEELCSRLFAGVVGFSVSGRLLTATEEIDISIVNDSQEPRFRREGVPSRTSSLSTLGK